MHRPFRVNASRRGGVSRGLLIGLGCLGVIVLLAVIVFGVGVSGYNALVASQEHTRQSWAEVQNQYKRRSDMIPNLVETVRGAKEFEQETLTAVTEARASVGRTELPRDLPTDPAELAAYMQAQQQLSSAPRSRACSWSASSTRPCARTTTSSRCRISSKAPRTASPSPAKPSRSRCGTTTRAAAASRAA
jgi:hypothetical protein